MEHGTRTRRRARFRPEAVSAAVSLTVVAAAAAVVAALPTLVIIPDAIAVGARGLAMACLAIAYATGIAMQPWLLPHRRRLR